ncbi:MAG: tetratricopeptide repeat protein [Amphritea sp.]
MQIVRKQLTPLLLGVLVVSGCATSTNYVPPVEERDESGYSRAPQVEIDNNVGNSDTAVTTGIGSSAPITPITTIVEQPRPAATTNPAVVALLESAKQKQQQGLYSAAQGSLERAQRIAPRDPQVYLQLADLRRQQGQYLQAEQLALKGVAVAAGQVSMERKLWLLIAEIRQEGGDSSGAQEARQKARLL